MAEEGKLVAVRKLIMAFKVQFKVKGMEEQGRRQQVVTEIGMSQVV